MGGVTLQVVTGLTRDDADKLLAAAQKKSLSTAVGAFKKKMVTYANITTRSVNIPDYIRKEVGKITHLPFYARITADNQTDTVVQATHIQPHTFKPYSNPRVNKSVQELCSAILSCVLSSDTRAAGKRLSYHG